MESKIENKDEMTLLEKYRQLSDSDKELFYNVTMAIEGETKNK